MKKDFKRKKRAGGKLDAQYVGPYIITEVHGKGTYRLLLMESKECFVERVSGTHLKLYIAVQSDDERMLQKRDMIAQKPVELECEVIELGKLNCSSIWEQLNSSNLLRLWRTGANDLHYEAKEDDETLDVSEIVVCVFMHIFACIFFIQGFITRFKAKGRRIRT